ncbi:MAG: hypothetical protein RLZZ337_1738 [Bacteroidota bacterium]
MKKIIVIATVLLGLTSCKEDITSFVQMDDNVISIPAGFPAIEFPEDNAFSADRWQLGKALFYDNRLSVDSSISCASCHKPALAFSDNVAFSKGAQNTDGVRNSPSLANVAYHPYFTREGGVPTLEMQVLVPIQEHNEFNFNIIEIAERLKDDTLYQRMSKLAYDREFDYFVITRAIANFERGLISGNSTYDKHMQFGNILSDDAKKGMELFYSDRTNCSSCHAGFNFTNYAFENNGLYTEYADIGRKRFTKLESDLALFKVPSLRNVALTAPYMHDGSFQTLDEVVEHYSSGGKNHTSKSTLIQPLELTNNEKRQLVLFLESLTDETFINNKKLQQ